MAAFFAASVVTQYPVGRLADRIGAPPVLLAGLVVFAIGSIGFALTTGPGFAIVFRGLQGIGSSAASIAEGAIIGSRVPLERQGRAFGAIYASQMGAFAIGPLLGSLAGLGSIRELFVAAGIAALAAWLPMGRMASRMAQPEREEPVTLELGPIDDIATREGFISARIVSLLHRNQNVSIFTRGLIGAIAFFSALGFLGGAYESCWTLLLDARGATTFQIGLSWTLFALPFAALSVPAGRVAERVNRKRLAMVSILISAGFAVLYPFMHAVVLLIGLGSVEAVCAVFGGPSAMMIVTQSVGVNDQGAAQGVVGTSRTAATAIAAAISGVLFGIDPVVPFAVASGLVLLALLIVQFSWRRS